MSEDSQRTNGLPDFLNMGEGAMDDTKYKGDRGDPTGPNCGSSTLLFDGVELTLFAGPASGGTVTEWWTARSGRKTSGYKFEYGILYQLIPDFGPIPEGEYWVQPMQMETVNVESDGWGEKRLLIHPRPTTFTFGRGGFFIHGGWKFGSGGCIDVSDGMFSFTDRMALLSNPQRPNPCTIPLTVKYAQLTVSAP
jgi:hypothetical protein